MNYKYIVFRAVDMRGKGYYIFGTFGKNREILPMFSFYNIPELRIYLEEYNKDEVLVLLKG